MTADSHQLLLLSLGQHKRCGKGNTHLRQDEPQTLSVNLFQRQETSCGAVKAAMKADTVPGQISSLYPHLRPAVERSAGNLDKAIESNARLQAELLRTSSTVIRDAANAGKVKVAAGVYDLASGKVSLS